VNGFACGHSPRTPCTRARTWLCGMRVTPDDHSRPGRAALAWGRRWRCAWSHARMCESTQRVARLAPNGEGSRRAAVARHHRGGRGNTTLPLGASTSKAERQHQSAGHCRGWGGIPLDHRGERREAHTHTRQSRGHQHHHARHEGTHLHPKFSGDMSAHGPL
jgi:hypothetical protein